MVDRRRPGSLVLQGALGAGRQETHVLRPACHWRPRLLPQDFRWQTCQQNGLRKFREDVEGVPIGNNIAQLCGQMVTGRLDAGTKSGGFGLDCLRRSFRSALVTSQLYRFLFELQQRSDSTIPLHSRRFCHLNLHRYRCSPFL